MTLSWLELIDIFLDIQCHTWVWERNIKSFREHLRVFWGCAEFKFNCYHCFAGLILAESLTRCLCHEFNKSITLNAILECSSLVGAVIAWKNNSPIGKRFFLVYRYTNISYLLQNKWNHERVKGLSLSCNTEKLSQWVSCKAINCLNGVAICQEKSSLQTLLLP